MNENQLVNFMKNDVARFNKARPGAIEFNHYSFRNFDMRHLDLSGITFTHCDLSGANWAKNHVDNTIFLNCSLDDMDVSYAEWSNVKMDFCSARRVYFRGSSLSMRVTNTSMNRTNFADAHIYKTAFHKVDLFESWWESTRFEYVDFTKCDHILRLENFDERGYSLMAIRHARDIYFQAGCRWFTLDEAISYWGSQDYREYRRGQRYVEAVQWMAKVI